MNVEWSRYDIKCDRCGKYLFTEYNRIMPTAPTGNYRRENDKENYFYDDIADEFICDECRGKGGE